MASITLKGNAVNTIGNLPASGSKVPEFCLTKGDLSDASLADICWQENHFQYFPQ